MGDIARVIKLVQSILRLPFYESLPGAALEQILAHVYGGRTTGTYDFVDVVNDETRIGWQVKSTRHSTPVTWKRAKLPDKESLINESRVPSGAQVLGDAIIRFCNHAAKDSVEKYQLKSLKYARLIDYMDGRLTYFERKLPISGNVFNPRDFTWSWSPQRTASKEQLSAFHGFHVNSGRAWFAWHGRGENQLHFKGERHWWPTEKSSNRRDFSRSGDRLSVTDLADLIATHAPPLKKAPS